MSRWNLLGRRASGMAEEAPLLKLVYSSAAAAVLAGAAHGQGFAGDREFYEWMMGYYANPEPGRIVPAIQHFVSSELSNVQAQRDPMLAFFGGVFDESEEAQREATEAFLTSGNRRGQWVVAMALWLGEDEEADEELRDLAARSDDDWIPQLAAQLESTLSPIDADQAISSPGQIDLLWARFFATGGREPVRRIAEVVRWTDGEDRVAALAQTARWSLLANAKQHTRVLEILRALAGDETHVRGREELESIVREAEAALDAAGEEGAAPEAPDGGEGG